MMDLREIERRLTSVFADAKGWIPDVELKQMQSLVDHGEPGIALENFITQLDEHGVALPRGMATEVRELATQMGMPIPSWFEQAADA